MSHTYNYTQPTIFSGRFDISHEIGEAEKRCKRQISSSREDLEGELLDTGDRVKRWFKRYNKQGPQFA